MLEEEMPSQFRDGLALDALGKWATQTKLARVASLVSVTSASVE